MRKRVAIIGSTGSIGVQALDVARQNPDKIEIIALVAGSSDQILIDQVKEFKPEYAAIFDEKAYKRLSSECSCWTGQGIEAIQHLSGLDNVDQVLVAVSGSAGIWPAYSAVKAGKQVALANKESLVMAGSIIMPLAAQTGARIIPVDSEHSAIFQCLRDEGPYIHQLWLTASGGPFRKYPAEDLGMVTPEMALRHPNWQMGPKITIDSATLMNKGLEVIEAFHLFGVDYDRIKVIVHPESVIHSLVEFSDGSMLGHLGVPDMRIPIQYAFSYPDRWGNPCSRLNLADIAQLNFASPDLDKFPALRLAFQAGRIGGTMTAAMNAANEVAVELFRAGNLSFTGISALVEKVMNRHEPDRSPTLEQITAVDKWAREESINLINEVK
ncbi:MAG: 1-deoxy-D-xylulose-5-phosphate reductoisomerase [Ignavibacteriales bacterium]